MVRGMTMAQGQMWRTCGSEEGSMQAIFHTERQAIARLSRWRRLLDQMLEPIRTQQGITIGKCTCELPCGAGRGVGAARTVCMQGALAQASLLGDQCARADVDRACIVYGGAKAERVSAFVRYRAAASRLDGR